MRLGREKEVDATVIAGIDGRWITAGVVTGFLIAIYIMGRRTDFVTTWAQVGVEHLSLPFADMRFLMSALETHRAGGNPFVFSQCDPWLRPLNYPRAWLVLAPFGLGAKHTIALAILLAGGFYTTIYFLVGRSTIVQGLVYGVLLCSPAAMLAVERGNTDLVVFILLAVAALVFDRKAGVYCSYILITLAAILKLYPVCAFALGLRERRRRGIVLVLGGLAAFALYVYCTRSDLAHIVANTPQIKEISFGHRVMFQKLASMKFAVPIELWSKTAVCVSILLALLISRTVKPPEFSVRGRAATTIGAAVYVGIFVATSSFNYRLIFLLLLVPQLLAWAQQRGGYRWVGRALVLIIMGAMLLASARYP